MKPYTVLILRPGYVAESCGEDIYLAHVKAIDVHEAKKVAQKETLAVDIAGATEHCDYDDYLVIAVFEGHLEDLNSL